MQLDLIEHCWSQAKRYTRAYCNYMITALQKTIPAALDSMQLANIHNYFDRVSRNVYGYLESLEAGKDLEAKATEFKYTYKSHGRVGLHA